jgi:hypothetical protein
MIPEHWNPYGTPPVSRPGPLPLARRLPRRALQQPELLRDPSGIVVSQNLAPFNRAPDSFAPATRRNQPLVTAAARCPSTASAAASPARTAPSMYPGQAAAVSVAAQWIRPTGARDALPNPTHAPGVGIPE